MRNRAAVLYARTAASGIKGAAFLFLRHYSDANEKTILILAALLCCCSALNAEEFTSGGLNYRITGDSLPTVAGTMTNTEETVGMNETLTKRAKNLNSSIPTKWTNVDAVGSGFEISRFVQSLREGDIEGFMRRLQSFLSASPYELEPEQERPCY